MFQVGNECGDFGLIQNVLYRVYRGVRTRRGLRYRSFASLRMTEQGIWVALRMTGQGLIFHQVVGDIGGGMVGGGDTLEVVGDVALEARMPLLLPVVVGIDVRKDQDLPAFQDIHLGVEATTTTGGHPHEFRHESGADDGGFLCLNQGHRGIGMLQQQMLSKETMGHGPAGRRWRCGPG